MFAHSNRLTCKGALCAFACLLASCAAASSQQTTTDLAAQGDARAPMAFAKVLLFPATGGDTGGGFLWWGLVSDNAWQFVNVSSSNLIANAYGLGIHQVIGLPKWAEIDRYAMYSHMGADRFGDFKELPVGEQTRQQRLMMQAALADRYLLQAHRETREMPVYELVVANGGVKIAEEDIGGHIGSSFFTPGTGRITARWRTSSASSRGHWAVSLSTRPVWEIRNSITTLSGLRTS